MNDAAATKPFKLPNRSNLEGRLVEDGSARNEQQNRRASFDRSPFIKTKIAEVNLSIYFMTI